MLAQILPLAGLQVTLSHWVVFCAVVGVLLTLDLTVFHRHAHTPSLRESAGWTVFWCSLALGFNVYIWQTIDLDHAIQFLNGYLLEWTLSMDNVFVFIVIFSYFKISLKYQYRVLFWGILGAIAMRLTFILAAGALLDRFHWAIYIFGAFLLYTGVKLATHHGGESDPERNLITRLARRFLPIAAGDHGERFFVRLGGKLYFTQLFLVLLIVEGTDVVFAVDSVPAIYGVTEIGPWQKYIVFTSNVFAIMGLRALYFLLAGMVDMFRYLSYGLAAVLIFIGLKMLLVDTPLPYIGVLIAKESLPNWASLLIIVSLLGTAILASIAVARSEAAAEPMELPAGVLGPVEVTPDESDDETPDDDPEAPES